MRQYQLFTRPDNETGKIPLPLPVYLRSTGYKCLEKGCRENTTELHSPFFEMIWCARGIGEVVLFQESFQLYPDDIFLLSSERASHSPFALRRMGELLGCIRRSRRGRFFRRLRVSAETSFHGTVPAGTLRGDSEQNRRPLPDRLPLDARTSLPASRSGGRQRESR